MQKNRFVFMVPYAYGHITRDGSDGGAKRCAEALNFACEELYPTATRLFAVLTAGYNKQNPSEPRYPGECSLASEQSAFLERLGDESVHLVDPCSWGTLDETIHAIRLITDHVRLMRSSPEDEVHVVVASNPFHLYGRVALCWHLLRPIGWEIHFVKANHRFSLKEILQEIFLKIPYYLMINAMESWKILTSRNPQTISSR